MKNKVIIFGIITIIVAAVAFVCGTLSRTPHDGTPSELIIDGKYAAVGECGDVANVTYSTDDSATGIGFRVQCFCKARRLSDGAETVWISAMNPEFGGSYCQADDEQCIQEQKSYLTENCPHVCPYTCAAILKNVWQYGYTFKELDK